MHETWCYGEACSNEIKSGIDHFWSLALLGFYGRGFNAEIDRLMLKRALT